MISISAGIIFSVAVGDPDRHIAGFESLDYTEVGEVGTIPEFGGQAAVRTFVPLGSRTATKRAGAFNYGATTIAIADSINDAGQQLLSDGFDGVNEAQMHAFRLEHPDIGRVYFTGVISSFRYRTGDANTIRQLSATINLVGKPVAGMFVPLLDSSGNNLVTETGDRLLIWN